MGFLLVAGFLSAALSAQSDSSKGSIEGRVIHALTGAPIRGAVVVLTVPPPANSPLRLVAYSGEEGAFQFTGLPGGSYRLSANRGGFLERAARRYVQLGPEGRVSDAEIRLPPHSVILGRVLDEQGEPVDRARVTAYKQVFPNGRRQWERVNVAVETNELGEYRFANLTMGRYLVQAVDQRPAANNRNGSPPALFSVPTYYPNASLQQQAMPVAVGVGTEVRGIDVQIVKLRRPAAVPVSGKVTGLPAASQATVSVGLLAAGESSLGSTTTIAAPPDYSFQLSVPPGQYILVANVYSGSTAAFGSASLTIAGETAGVVLALSPAPEVTGRVRLPESGVKVNLENLRINLTKLGSALVSAVPCDAAGRLTLPKAMTPGHYAIVDVRGIPAGHFVSEVKVGGQAASMDDFEIAASTQLEVVLSNKAARIGGSAVDADGKPYPGASVTLIPADAGSRPAKVAADANGSFEFTSLAPGKYRIFAWEEVDSDVWPDPEFLKKHESRGTEVTVGASEARTLQSRVILTEELK